MTRIKFLTVIAALAVVSAALAAIAPSVLGPKVRTTQIGGWQTYCADPYRDYHWAETSSPIEITKLTGPTEDVRSAMFFIGEGGLRLWDVANQEQFAVSSSDRLEPVPPEPCQPFRYGEYEFRSGSGKISACTGSECTSIEVRPNTIPLSYAGADGSVFVGTSFGEALLFRNGAWCRMALDEQATVYFCPDAPRPIPDAPTNQFYSSGLYMGRTLLGEYPTGRLFEFDGETVFLSDLTPPQFDGSRTGHESQSIAFYCGDLYVGYWPMGEIYRFDGERWHDPLRLFDTPPNVAPFAAIAEEAGLIANFFGQRVSSMATYDGSLYVATSNKGDWNRRIKPDLPPEIASQYGAAYRIHRDGCS